VARALLYDAPDLTQGVRLLGVSIQQLSVPTPTQADLFGPDMAGGAAARQALERTIDAVRARFGRDAVGRAAPRVEHTPAVRENGDA
jgi:hypothetical protein